MPMFENSSALRFDGSRFTDVAGEYNHWDASYRPYNSHNGNYNLGANSGTSAGNVISMRTSRPRETISVAKNRGEIPLGIFQAQTMDAALDDIGDAPRQTSASKFPGNGERKSKSSNSVYNAITCGVL